MVKRWVHKWLMDEWEWIDGWLEGCGQKLMDVLWVEGGVDRWMSEWMDGYN